MKKSGNKSGEEDTPKGSKAPVGQPQAAQDKPTYKADDDTEGYKVIGAAESQRAAALRNKRGNSSRNNGLIPTADGHYARLTSRISDTVKTTLNGEASGRFVMINPSSTKTDKGPPKK